MDPLIFKDSDDVNITPLGAGGEVGRSCIMVSYKGVNIMLDCGIHPRYSGYSALPYLDTFDLSSVNLILITHFHMDHVGALPYVTEKTNFRGDIIMTDVTRRLSEVGLYDYVHIKSSPSAGVDVTGVVEQDDIMSIKSYTSNITGLYTKDDIESCFGKSNIRLINFHEHIILRYRGATVRVTALPAGHVMGASMFNITITSSGASGRNQDVSTRGGSTSNSRNSRQNHRGKKDRSTTQSTTQSYSATILYTGDFSCSPDRHLVGAVPPTDPVDIVICEATHGSSDHESRLLKEERFFRAVTEPLLHSRRCLIPVFSLGRVHELLLMLEEYWTEHKEMQKYGIYYVQPAMSRRQKGEFYSDLNNSMSLAARRNAASQAASASSKAGKRAGAPSAERDPGATGNPETSETDETETGTEPQGGLGLGASPLDSIGNDDGTLIKYLIGRSCQETTTEPNANMMAKGVDPYNLKYITFITSSEEKKIPAPTEPSVVFCSPGLLESGISRKLLEGQADVDDCAVIMTGYSVEGTLAHEILQTPTPESIKTLDGPDKKFVNKVTEVSFSAHTDFKGTLALLLCCRVSSGIVLIHSNKEQAKKQRDRLLNTLQTDDPYKAYLRLIDGEDSGNTNMAVVSAKMVAEYGNVGKMLFDMITNKTSAKASRNREANQGTISKTVQIIATESDCVPVALNPPGKRKECSILGETHNIKQFSPYLLVSPRHSEDDIGGAEHLAVPLTSSSVKEADDEKIFEGKSLEEITIKAEGGEDGYNSEVVGTEAQGEYGGYGDYGEYGYEREVMGATGEIDGSIQESGTASVTLPSNVGISIGYLTEKLETVVTSVPRQLVLNAISVLFAECDITTRAGEESEIVMDVVFKRMNSKNNAIRISIKGNNVSNITIEYVPSLKTDVCVNTLLSLLGVIEYYECIYPLNETKKDIRVSQPNLLFPEANNNNDKEEENAERTIRQKLMLYFESKGIQAVEEEEEQPTKKEPEDTLPVIKEEVVKEEMVEETKSLFGDDDILDRYDDPNMVDLYEQEDQGEKQSEPRKLDSRVREMVKEGDFYAFVRSPRSMKFDVKARAVELYMRGRFISDCVEVVMGDEGTEQLSTATYLKGTSKFVYVLDHDVLICNSKRVLQVTRSMIECFLDGFE